MFHSKGPNDDPWGHPLTASFQQIVLKRFPVDVRNRFKYASCRRVLLKAEKRNFLFQEYPGYMQAGALIFCDGEFIFSIPIYIGKAAL